jgi:hypothetical protein
MKNLEEHVVYTILKIVLILTIKEHVSSHQILGKRGWKKKRMGSSREMSTTTLEEKK